MDNKALIDYFIEETNKKFDRLEKKLDVHAARSYREFEALKKFKFTWTGGVVVANIIITILCTLWFSK